MGVENDVQGEMGEIFMGTTYFLSIAIPSEMENPYAE